MKEPQNGKERPAFQPGSDTPFLLGLGILGGSYAIIILAMIVADLAYVDKDSMLGALRSPEIHYSIVLSLLSCTLSTILSLWVAVPLGYLTSRFDFPGKRCLNWLEDVWYHEVFRRDRHEIMLASLLWQLFWGEAVPHCWPRRLHCRLAVQPC